MRFLLGLLAAFYVIRKTEGPEASQEFVRSTWNGFANGVYLLFFGGLIAICIYNLFR